MESPTAWPSQRVDRRVPLRRRESSAPHHDSNEGQTNPATAPGTPSAAPRNPVWTNESRYGTGEAPRPYCNFRNSEHDGRRTALRGHKATVTWHARGSRPRHQWRRDGHAPAQMGITRAARTIRTRQVQHYGPTAGEQLLANVPAKRGSWVPPDLNELHLSDAVH